MKTFYFVNPEAGGRQALARFEKIRASLPAGELVSDWDQSIDHSCLVKGSRLIAAGGDGTLHRLVNQLVTQVGLDLIGQFKIGHLGLGSNNSFLKPYGSCSKFEGFPARLGQETYAHDLGQVRYIDDAGNTQVRYFTSNASLGLLAQANHRFNTDSQVARLKKFSADVADVVTFVKTLRSFEPDQVEMDIQGVTPKNAATNPAKNLSGTFTNIHVIKHPFYASDLRFDEEPGLDSGHFHVHWLNSLSKPKVAGRFLEIFAFKRFHRARTAFSPASQLKIATGRRTALEMDGEVIWGSSFEISCRKSLLRICT